MGPGPYRGSDERAIESLGRRMSVVEEFVHAEIDARAFARLRRERRRTMLRSALQVALLAPVVFFGAHLLPGLRIAVMGDGMADPQESRVAVTHKCSLSGSTYSWWEYEIGSGR